MLIYIQTTRPFSSLVAGTLTTAVLMARPGRMPLADVEAGLAMTVLTMFGFVLNDVFDFRKDAAAGVRRPIATQELSVPSALVFCVFLLFIVILLSMTVGSGGDVLAVTGVGLVAYSPLAHRFPLFKGPGVACLCCAPLFYGAVLSGAQFPWFSYAVLAFFVIGRETLMDSVELVGDSRAGLKTIAAALGYGRARRLGATIMFVSGFGVLAIASGSVGRVAATTALLSLIAIFVWPHLSDARRIQLSRFPMFLGAVAIAFGVK